MLGNIIFNTTMACRQVVDRLAPVALPRFCNAGAEAWDVKLKPQFGCYDEVRRQKK